MNARTRYPVPAGRHRVEDGVRRSRFITTITRARTREEAESFVEGVRAEFADATHNCWAYVAGPPGSSAVIGMSDDGEPHGTAGRPILETLLHSGVGEVAVVVTRYFGGVKLGKGGLARAYAGGAAHALETMRRAERVERRPVRVVCDYAARDPILRFADELEAEVRDEQYGADVVLSLAVPVTAVDRFVTGVAGITAGAAVVRMLDQARAREGDDPAGGADDGGSAGGGS